MTMPDPYSPGDEQLFECRDCEARLRADGQPGKCPECGGVLRNIGVPRN